MAGLNQTEWQKYEKFSNQNQNLTQSNFTDQSEKSYIYTNKLILTLLIQR